jgi:hypothetical protein
MRPTAGLLRGVRDQLGVPVVGLDVAEWVLQLSAHVRPPGRVAVATFTMRA